MANLKKIIISLMLLSLTIPCYAQFAKNIIIYDDGVHVDGGGRQLNFATGDSVTFNDTTQHYDIISDLDLSGYVPYTGATANVDLGAFDLLASDITLYNVADTNLTLSSAYGDEGGGVNTFDMIESGASATAHEFGTAYNFGFRWLYDPDTNNLSLSTGEHTTVTELLSINYATKDFDFIDKNIITLGDVAASTFNSGTLSGNNSGDQKYNGILDPDGNSTLDFTTYTNDWVTTFAGTAHNQAFHTITNNSNSGTYTHYGLKINYPNIGNNSNSAYISCQDQYREVFRVKGRGRVIAGAGLEVNSTGWGDATGNFLVKTDTSNIISTDAANDLLYLGGTTNGIRIGIGGALTLIGTNGDWDLNASSVTTTGTAAVGALSAITAIGAVTVDSASHVLTTGKGGNHDGSGGDAGDGGDITLTAGDGGDGYYNATRGSGGDIILHPGLMGGLGDSGGSPRDGIVNVQSTLEVNSADGPTAENAPAAVVINAGDGGIGVGIARIPGGDGGIITFTTGDGGEGEAPTANDGSGGDLTLATGAGGTTHAGGNGGDIILSPSAIGSGVDGKVLLNAATEITGDLTVEGDITLGDGSAADPRITFDSGNDGYIEWQEDEEQFHIEGGVEISTWLTIGTVLTTQDLIIGDAGEIELDVVPASDHTGTGIIATMTVDANTYGVASALHLDTDGNWIEADADAATTMPCTALALETGTGSKKVLFQGIVRDDTWNWTVGGIVYISTTVGQLTQTAPSGTGDQVQVVGIATHADRIYFNPSLVLVEVS